MPEFSTKLLVEHVKSYMQLSKQIKQAGYNQFLGIKRKNAQQKVEEQIRLYEAQKQQIELKLKPNPNNQQ